MEPYRAILTAPVDVSAFGTDTLFDTKLAARQGAQLAKLIRWFAPAEMLQQASCATLNCWRCPGRATSIRTGPGVIAEGALADLILVDGDPVADTSRLPGRRRRSPPSSKSAGWTKRFSIDDVRLAVCRNDSESRFQDVRRNQVVVGS